MTDEGKRRDEERENRLHAIREEVTALAEEEALAYPDTSSNNGKISSTFVGQCLRAQELGAGLLYREIHRDRFIYSNAAGEWLAWSGHNWEVDIMETHLAAMEVVVTRLLEESRDIGQKITWAVKKKDTGEVKRLQAHQKLIYKKVDWLRQDRGRSAAIKFARTCEEPLAIRGDELDLHPWLLPCKNGIIDLRSGKLRDGRPEEYLFLASPTEWKGLGEKAERWEAFLMEIMEGSVPMVQYLQRLLGYAVTGLAIEHIFPIFYGQNGRNGKGKIVEAINHVLGSLVGSIQSEMLLDQKHPRSSAGPSPDIAGLKGLRMAFASETDEGQRFSSARVKWLTGGDQLVGRFPHDKREIRFQQTHTLFLMTNREPKAPADDQAFWERVHLIPFRLSFVDREPVSEHERRADKYLGEKLKEEASGILAWLVRGCLEYRKMGLEPPTDILEATAKYRREEDVLGDWLDDYCDTGPDEKGQATELYDHFVKWYWNNVSKKREFSQRRFGTLMGRKFEKIKSVGTVFYVGVDLNPNAPEIEVPKDWNGK